jgi:23S rRNA (guanosine2251-2'-O)-methyltransferase
LKEQSGAKIYKLDSHASESLFEMKKSEKIIFVLGNESSGVSSEVSALCDSSLAIPMQRGVESLNVAITAALIAFSI